MSGSAFAPPRSPPPAIQRQPGTALPIMWTTPSRPPRGATIFRGPYGPACGTASRNRRRTAPLPPPGCPVVRRPTHQRPGRNGRPNWSSSAKHGRPGASPWASMNRSGAAALGSSPAPTSITGQPVPGRRPPLRRRVHEARTSQPTRPSASLREGWIPRMPESITCTPAGQRRPPPTPRATARNRNPSSPRKIVADAGDEDPVGGGSLPGSTLVRIEVEEAGRAARPLQVGVVVVVEASPARLAAVRPRRTAPALDGGPQAGEEQCPWASGPARAPGISRIAAAPGDPYRRRTVHRVGPPATPTRSHPWGPHQWRLRGGLTRSQPAPRPRTGRKLSGSCPCKAGTRAAASHRVDPVR